jgi:hypothetical protein
MTDGKRARVDSQVPTPNSSTEYDNYDEVDEVIFVSEQPVNNAIADKEQAGFTSTAANSEPAVEPPSDGQVTRPVHPVDAPINVNGKRVGKYNGDRVVLEANSFLDADGRALELAKPGKRVLRLGGRNEGIDGFTLNVPKRSCSLVEMAFTEQGCRLIMDGDVVVQKTRADDVNQLHLDALIAEDDARRRAAEEAAPVNEAYAQYVRWRKWVDEKLEDIPAMTNFPLLPVSVRLCKIPDCSQWDEEGVKRPLRHNKHCKHDMEKWFHEAAGGYNDRYLEIITSEKDRWEPQQFGGDKEELTAKEQKFRRMAGETWKFAYELIDEYEMRKWGY